MSSLFLPQAIVFDLDGTLIDSEVVIRKLWKETMSEFGYQLDDSLHAQLLGRRLRDVDHILANTFGEELPIPAIRERVKSTYERCVQDGLVQLKPGVVEVLACIDKLGIKRAIATSTGIERAKFMLNSVQLEFELVVGGDQIANGKPSPDIYIEVMRQFGLRPQESWAVEDSHSGMTSALSAGLTAIMIPDLLPALPEYPWVARSFHDVVDWINGLAT